MKRKNRRWKRVWGVGNGKSVLFVTNSFPKSCPSSQTCFIVPKNWINIATSLCIPKYLCKYYPRLSSTHPNSWPGPISHSYKYFVRNAICHKISKKDLNRLISWLRLSEQQMNEIQNGRRTREWNWNTTNSNATANANKKYEKLSCQTAVNRDAPHLFKSFIGFIVFLFSFSFCVIVIVNSTRPERACKEISKRANKRKANGSNLQSLTRNYLCGTSKKTV